MKLNLGCGQNLYDGFVNVDKYGKPDVKHDLETFPWPWGDSEVDQVVLYHSLEHMGAKIETFIGIMKELYRVCADKAVIHIAVPHPRHDSFIDDPTHVRIVTPELLGGFCKRFNLMAQKDGSPNTPFALYHGVDFEIDGHTCVLEEPYATELREGKITDADLTPLLRKYNNVAKEWRINLRVVKGVTA